MRIYKVDFEPLYPVPYGCIIAAKDMKEALEIAKKTITHTKYLTIEEVDVSESGVVFYESGDY